VAVAIDNSHLFHSVKQADRQKDEFLAMLAHELRNPIASLKGNAQLLAERLGEGSASHHKGSLVDKASLVVTGKNLKLTTSRDVVTARDSLEWYDHDQLAVARGDAVAVRDQKKVRADTLTALVERDQSGAQHLTRVDAHGNVVVTSQDQIGRGDAGVYNVETGISTLIGNVRLTRGGNEMRGQYAVIDLNHNVSRLLSTPPSTKLTGGPAPGPVQGLIYPRQQGAPVTTPKQ